MKKQIRVLVVERTPHNSGNLLWALQADKDITVIDHVARVSDAPGTAHRARPDLIALDLGGEAAAAVKAIEEIMAETPTPILILTDHVGRESTEVMEALAAGAVDAIPKPTHWDDASAAALRARARLLQGVTVVRHPRGRLTPGRRRRVSAYPVVGIAASAGGPAALADVLAGLGGLQAPILVVQHLHPDFLEGFVRWMARVCPLPVEIAGDGATAHQGVVYIGPGGTHLKLAGQHRMSLDPTPIVFHRPSANELFKSLAAQAGEGGIGVILTGMGDDGATGLLELRNKGGTTISQDAGSSAVFGMPQAAQPAGAVTRTLPLEVIPQAIKDEVRRRVE